MGRILFRGETVEWIFSAKDGRDLSMTRQGVNREGELEDTGDKGINIRSSYRRDREYLELGKGINIWKERDTFIFRRGRERKIHVRYWT